MSRLNQIGSHKTTVKERNNVLSVVYHSTEVVKFDRKNKILTLDTGGHFSNTTKNRMNQTSNQFDLGFKVYQKNFEWFVFYNEADHKFVENIVHIFLQ